MMADEDRKAFATLTLAATFGAPFSDASDAIDDALNGGTALHRYGITANDLDGIINAIYTVVCTELPIGPQGG